MADLRVVSETPEIEIKRKRAEEDLDLPFRELAANVLRIVRGAGKPEDLLDQMQHAIDVSAQHRQVHGAWPAPSTLAEILRLDDPNIGSEVGLIRATHPICRASLQICASRLVQQDTHRRTAENDLHMRIVDIETARAKRRKTFVRKSRRKPPEVIL